MGEKNYSRRRPFPILGADEVGHFERLVAESPIIGKVLRMHLVARLLHLRENVILALLVCFGVGNPGPEIALFDEVRPRFVGIELNGGFDLGTAECG